MKKTRSNLINKVKKNLSMFIVFFVIGFAVLSIGLTIEVALNPWAKSAAKDFSWWNIFTTRDVFAIMFYKSKIVILFIIVFISAGVSLFSIRDN